MARCNTHTIVLFIWTIDYLGSEFIGTKNTSFTSSASYKKGDIVIATGSGGSQAGNALTASNGTKLDKIVHTYTYAVIFQITSDGKTTFSGLSSTSGYGFANLTLLQFRSE